MAINTTAIAILLVSFLVMISDYVCSSTFIYFLFVISGIPAYNSLSADG